MFVGGFPLWAELRTADIDQAGGVVPALKEIMGELRKHWKRTRIILRGDSGFNRPDIPDWCESEENAFYVIGLQKKKGSFAP